MLQELINLDQQITLFINSFYCDFSDQVWAAITNKYAWFPIYAIILGIIFWRLGWKKGLVATVSLALTILCVDQFANFIKDDVVCRLRPCNDPSMVLRGLHIVEPAHPKYCYGFFSGHAANSFAFAMASTMILRKDKRLKWNGYAVAMLVWAALIGLSRIFVAKHFFGDVLVGAIVGTIMAWAITKLVFAIATSLGIK